VRVGEQLVPFVYFMRQDFLYLYSMCMCVSAYATHVMQFMRLPSGLERDDGCGMAGLTALVGLVKQKLMTLPSLSKCGLVALGCLWAFVSVYVHRLSAKTARTTNKRLGAAGNSSLWIVATRASCVDTKIVLKLNGPC